MDTPPLNYIPMYIPTFRYPTCVVSSSSCIDPDTRYFELENSAEKSWQVFCGGSVQVRAVINVDGRVREMMERTPNNEVWRRLHFHCVRYQGMTSSRPFHMYVPLKAGLLEIRHM